MSDKVIMVPCVGLLDVPADRVLDKMMGELKSVVIMGCDHDGNEYFASSLVDGGDPSEPNGLNCPDIW